MPVSIHGVELRGQRSFENPANGFLETMGTVYLNGRRLGGYHDDGKSIVPRFGFDADWLDGLLKRQAPEYSSNTDLDYPYHHLRSLLVDLSDLNDLYKVWAKVEDGKRGMISITYGSFNVYVFCTMEKARAERDHYRKTGRVSQWVSGRFNVLGDATARFFACDGDWAIGEALRLAEDEDACASGAFGMPHEGAIKRVWLKAGFYDDGSTVRIDLIERTDDGTEAVLGELTVFDEPMPYGRSAVNPKMIGYANSLIKAGALSYAYDLSISGYHIVEWDGSSLVWECTSQNAR